MGVRQIWRFIRVTERPPMDFVDAITPILRVASPKLPRSRRNATGVLFATCFLLCTDAAAQPTTGAVRGIVRDQSGGVLPAVQLFLTDPLTHLTQQRSTDERGEFSFQFVEPREYSLIATLPGFKTVRVNELRVHVAATSTVSLVMEVGGVTNTIAVTAIPIPSERSDGSITTVVDSRSIERLPNLNRHVLEAAALAPGLDVLAGSGQVIGVDGNAVLASGHRRSQNSYYLDGAENAGAWRNSALQIPNPDAIAEVQVQTANASVQFGKYPGAAINFVTRSGTDQFHGTLFHFAHDKRLNANLWLNNRNGLPKPDDTQRYTGGVIGGPLRRQHTFFFASFNRYSTNNVITQQGGRFPTEPMKRGDFSAVPDFVRQDGSTVPFDIKDPVTGQSLGKTIPPERINSASRRFLPLLPSAAVYYDTAVRQVEKPVTNDEYLGKIDHSLLTSQRLSGLVMYTRGSETDPSQGFASNTVPAWGALQRTGRQTTASVKHTWALNTSWLIESRASLVQSSSDIYPSDQSRGPRDVGILFPWTPPITQLPSLRLDGQGGFRADHANTDYVGQRNYRLGGTAVWLKGAHQMKFGSETQVDMVRFEGNRELRTSFVFTGRDVLNGPITPSQTPLSANSFGVQNFGYAWADFLLGRVTSFSIAGYAQTGNQFRSNYLFVEDEWRLTLHLTVTAGLRYELAGHAKEIYGHAGGAFVAGHQSSRFPNAPVGLAWPGDDSVPKGLFPLDLNDFAPRIGLAYDVSGRGRTVIRGSIGQYHAMIPLASRRNWGASGFGGAPSTGANARLDDPFGTSKVNPYDTESQYGPGRPVPDPLVGYTPETFPWESLFTTQLVRGVPTHIFIGNLVGSDPNVQTPSSTQFNVMLERQLREGWLVGAGYVGARGRHEPMWQALNAPIPEAGGDLSAQSMRDRRPLPAYGDGRLYATILDTQYDSLQISSTLRRPIVTTSVSYVLARSRSPFGINATGADADDLFGFSTGSASAEAIFDTASGAGQSTYPYDIERDRAEVGRRHTFKLHYVIEVPEATRAGGWMAKLFRGWAFSGVFAAVSGLPLNIIWGLDANADGSAVDRPKIVGDIRYPRTAVMNPSADRRGAVQYIDPAGFTGPCGNTARSGPEAFCTQPGNLPRNAARGVPLFNADLATIRNISLGRTRRIELRLEVFNATNTNFLAAPTLDLASPFFGQVVTRIHRPRQVQAGVKFYF